jgi:hypothetical protein
MPEEMTTQSEDLMVNRTQSPQGLNNNPSIQPRVVPASQLLHHFHVEYLVKDTTYVLQPGQVIPVWDLKKWKLVDYFEVHCSNAVRWNEYLISAPGFENQLENAVTAAAFQALRDRQPDQMAQAIHSQLARIYLGNVGGRTVLRPDYLPVGVVPMEGRYVNRERTVIQTPLSMLDWAMETEGMEVVADMPPAVKFFIGNDAGDAEGFNIRTGKAQTLTEIPLPFAYSSGESMGILRGLGEDVQREMQTLLAIAEGVRRTAVLNEWKGTIYFGYDLPAAGEGLPNVETALLGLDHYLTNQRDIEAVYEIPFLGDNPLDVLNREAYNRIEALLNKPRLHQIPRDSLSDHAHRHAATV